MVAPRNTAGPWNNKDPLLVNLDLNKWIDLAHAEAGTERGQHYEAALVKARELVTEERVIFPLCFAHFIEVAKIGNHTQRKTLARLMVTLSRGWFLSSASSLLMCELRRAIARRFGQSLSDQPFLALTRSIKMALADLKGVEVSRGFNETPFQSSEVLESFIATARVGPEFLKAWRGFADRHEANRTSRWDTSREIRKRAYCALVTIGIRDRLAAALSEFHLPFHALEDLGPNGCVALLEAVPMLNIEINLFVERNEHRDRKIEPNDEIDIGFLSLAVPYCHVVITEKFWMSIIRRLNLDMKYQTFVGNDVNEILSLPM